VVSLVGFLAIGLPVLVCGGLATYLFSNLFSRMPGAAQRDDQSPQAGPPTGSDNLRQIGAAFKTYHAEIGRLPSATGARPQFDQNTWKPLLSWRVHLLPYLNQESLYKEFKLDEPWDSPANKRLIDRMPKVYETPGASLPPGQTYYKVFVGYGAAFEPRQYTRFQESFSDGLQYTILAVEGGAPVIWTKPEDIPFDRNKPLPDLSLAGNPRINVLLADGTTRIINLERMPPQTIKHAIERNDGIPLGANW
jgi:hypothetical protein